MQALVVDLGVAHSARVEDLPEPNGDGVLVRVLEVGICGTDREIAEGLFGVAPENGQRLVLGHELLGLVARDHAGFARGDLVSAIVRRSCGKCIACDEGAPDSCLTGAYRERGITRLDGFARELVLEDADQLVAIPRQLGRLGVLAEPTSICARAVRHALAIGRRQPWRPARALVLGGGAIGVLSTLLLRLEGLEVCTASLEPSNEIVEALGADYVSTGEGEVEVESLGGFDLVIEAAGNAELMARSLGLLRRSGIVCLLGLDGRDRPVSVPGRVLGVDTVLENRVLFGSVNAHREDWHAAVDALDRARERFPDALERLIALRVPLDRFGDALAYGGGKATLVVSDT